MKPFPVKGNKLSPVIPRSPSSPALGDPRRTPGKPFKNAVEKPSGTDGQGRKRP